MANECYDPDEPPEAKLLAVLARLTFDYDTDRPGLLDSGGLSSGEYAIEVLADRGLVIADGYRWAEWTSKGVQFLTTSQQEAITDPAFREPDGKWPKNKVWRRGDWDFGRQADIPLIVQVSEMAGGIRSIVGAIAGQCRQWNTGDGPLGKCEGRQVFAAPHGALAVLSRFGLIEGSQRGAVWTKLGQEVLQD